MRRFRLAHHLKISLWFIPLIFVVGGVAASLLCTSFDDGTLLPRSITGDPHAALQILYLIAFSMLTLTGLVLSLVVVVVQLAMGIFSPRIVRQILQDRPSQCAIGLFAGTFAFAVLAIREVHSTGDDQSVPGIALVGSLALALACIGTLLWYIDHVGQSVRVAALVEWVADDTLSTLSRVCPMGDEIEPEPHVVTTPQGGVLFEIGHERLVAAAEDADCVLEMQCAVGDYVPAGAPLCLVQPNESRDVLEPARLHKRVLRSVALGPERTMNQDVAYGIRMLVDIAERSLATGEFVDPTTAVQAIDRIHDVMRQLARRTLPTGRYTDDDGQLRLTVPTLGWDGYVRLAFDEVRQVGATSPQIGRRLKDAFEDLLTVAPESRQASVQRQLRLLTGDADAAARASDDEHESLVGDRAGLGSGSDLLIDRRRSA